MDERKIEELGLRIVGDLRKAVAVAFGYFGNQLGLFRRLAERGKLTIENLASESGVEVRYVEEWAEAMISAGYVRVDPATGEIWLTPEQQFLLANPEASLFQARATSRPRSSVLADLVRMARSKRPVSWKVGDLHFEVTLDPVAEMPRSSRG